MKKVLFLLCLGIIGGCTITRTTYEGTIDYPRNIIFDNANFKYIKTISGSSHAIYDGWGYGKKRVSEGLINTAKANMYSNHKFMPNQVITNISRDVIRTYDEKGFVSKYEVKVVISADVYEFSNNGDYYSKTEQIMNNTVSEKNTKKQSVNNNKSSIEGFRKGHYDVISKGDVIIYTTDGKTFYKAEVYESVKPNNIWIEVFNIHIKKNGKWVLFSENESLNEIKKIPLGIVTHHKKG